MLAELKNSGLSDKEARVYLAMLELGPASVLEIAAKAGINRPTAYVQIEFLKKQGLVSTQARGKKQLFIAESPSQLGHLLAFEKKQIEQKEDDLKKLIPQLMTLFNLGEEKPVVRYFEGKEGLKTIQREVAETKDREMREIFCVDDVERVFSAEERSEQSERLNPHINYRAIFTRSSGLPQNIRPLDALREVPTDLFSFSVDIIILDELVAFASLRERLSGAIIEHREIAKTLKSFFDLAWAGTENIQKSKAAVHHQKM